MLCFFDVTGRQKDKLLSHPKGQGCCTPPLSGGACPSAEIRASKQQNVIAISVQSKVL
jgi:hypothetical protein